MRFFSLHVRFVSLSLACTLLGCCWLFIQSNSLRSCLGCRHTPPADHVPTDVRLDSGGNKHFMNRILKCAEVQDVGLPGRTTVSGELQDRVETEVLAIETNHVNQRSDHVMNLVKYTREKRYSDGRIDKHEYDYIHNPEDICGDATGQVIPVYVLFLVVTSPENSKRRDVIRATYGDKRCWPKLSEGVIKRVFLLGTTEDVVHQRNIDAEFAAHGDIVQEDFVDSYANLTLKTVMGLKWATNYCHHALYVVKVDDDTMFNRERFLATLREALPNAWAAGQAKYDAPVFRDTSSKFYVSEEFYPLETYPPYLNGPAYILTSDMVEALYRVAQSTPLFPWEDVYLGICLKELRVELAEMTRFLKLAEPAALGDLRRNKKALRKMKLFVSVTNLTPDQMEIVWDMGKL